MTWLRFLIVGEKGNSKRYIGLNDNVLLTYIKTFLKNHHLH